MKPESHTAKLALLGLLFLAACERPLTNEEIVKEIKICQAAGLVALALHENVLMENSITRIECQPK